MTAPGDSIIVVLLALVLVVASAYAAGRIHQWYRNGVHRDRAYREGYDKASHSLFDMAMHKRSAAGAEIAVPTPGTSIPRGRSASVGALRRRISIGSAPKSDGAHGRHSAA
jgi:hypothetical protein